MVDHMGAATVSFGDDDTAAEIEAYVADALAENDAEVLDYDAEVACSVDGDAAWKVTYDDVEQRVRVTAVAPEALYVQTRPDDPLAVESVAQRYRLEASDFPVLFPGRLTISARDAWITEEWTDQLWRVWLNDAVALEEPNPYGFIPYVVYANFRNPREFWGRGDPERILRLQDRLNYAEADADDIMALAATIIVFEGVDNADQLSVRPGAVWTLPEDAKATVLDMLQGNGLTQRLEYINRIRQRTHDIARVPTSVLGSEQAARNFSGVALQTELGPLIRLVARKRRTRTAALRRRAQLIAALGAMFDGLPQAATRPTVTWTEAVPADRADELKNAVTERSLGRDPEAVLRSIGIEDAKAELDATLAWLARGLPQAGAKSSDRTDPDPDARPDDAGGE